MVEWEYMVKNGSVSAQVLAAALNIYGKDGWELVNVVATSPHDVYLFLKRPIVEEVPKQEAWADKGLT